VSGETDEMLGAREALIQQAKDLQSEVVAADKDARAAQELLTAAMLRRADASTKLGAVTLQLAEMGETLESVDAGSATIAYPGCCREIALIMSKAEGQEMRVSAIIEAVEGYSANSVRAALQTMKRAGAVESMAYGWWRLAVAPESVGGSMQILGKRNPAADWIMSRLQTEGKAMRVNTLEAMAPEEVRRQVKNALHGLVSRGILQRYTRGAYYFATTEVEDARPL
jgi:hypothetical protein